MPVAFIEAPSGIKPEAKKTLMRKITGAIDDAYVIGDTLIFMCENPADNVAMDGARRIRRDRRSLTEDPGTGDDATGLHCARNRRYGTAGRRCGSDILPRGRKLRAPLASTKGGKS
jgi:hypothetical protein